jgi:tetratricopeptide (TPR) repeat protein
MKPIKIIVVILALTAILTSPSMSQASKYWQEKADQLLLNGSYQDAMVALNKGIKLDSSDSNLWNTLGWVQLNLQDYEKARQSSDKAIELNSSLASAWITRGIAQVNLGQLDKAVSSLNRATELKPNSYESWFFKGSAQYKMGNLEDALNSFDRATQINPNDPVSWNDKGVILMEMGRNNAALVAFDKALKLNPSYDTALLNKRSIQENSAGRPSAGDAILSEGSAEGNRALQRRTAELGFHGNGLGDPNSNEVTRSIGGPSGNEFGLFTSRHAMGAAAANEVGLTEDVLI